MLGTYFRFSTYLTTSPTLTEPVWWSSSMVTVRTQGLRFRPAYSCYREQQERCDISVDLEQESDNDTSFRTSYHCNLSNCPKPWGRSRASGVATVSPKLSRESPGEGETHFFLSSRCHNKGFATHELLKSKLTYGWCMKKSPMI